MGLQQVAPVVTTNGKREVFRSLEVMDGGDVKRPRRG
jgi:hypothetical protein